MHVRHGLKFAPNASYSALTLTKSEARQLADLLSDRLRRQAAAVSSLHNGLDALIDALRNGPTVRVEAERFIQRLEINGHLVILTPMELLDQTISEIRERKGNATRREEEGSPHPVNGRKYREPKESSHPAFKLDEIMSKVAELPISAEIPVNITILWSPAGTLEVSRRVRRRGNNATGKKLLDAETTDRFLALGTDGRAFTLSFSDIRKGSQQGGMFALPNGAGIAGLLVFRPGEKLLVASTEGDGFVVAADDVVAQTRAGKQVLTLREGVRAALCKTVAGDHVAVVGENRKVLIFPLDELPEMAKGKGVRLQKYKDGGLSDATTFNLAAGLSWKDPAGRTRTETELGDWLAKRATAGRMAPRGFPRDNKFN